MAATVGINFTTKWFHSKPQRTGGENDCLDSL